MYELEYWCPARGCWLRVEGPDYDNLTEAIAVANHYATSTGRVMRVVDWQQAVYQTG